MRIWEWTFALLLILVFAPAVGAMSQVWNRLDYYSHGYLVPVVALWVVAVAFCGLPKDFRGGIGHVQAPAVSTRMRPCG